MVHHGWQPAQLVIRIVRNYCHHLHLLFCNMPSSSSNKSVQQLLMRPCLNDANKGRLKEWLLRLGTKELLHCAVYCYFTCAIALTSQHLHSEISRIVVVDRKYSGATLLPKRRLHWVTRVAISSILVPNMWGKLHVQIPILRTTNVT